jgi:cysteinyl-tRNA synthetase
MPTPIKLYDSYQKKEIILNPDETVINSTLKLYSCGPTVYNYMHIGNLRAAWLGDVISRVGKLAGWDTQWISNITDVGHLVDDGDNGEDKLEKGAKREGKKVQDIINFYTDDYVKQCQAIGIDLPTGVMRPKATEYIEEQMILSLELLIARKAYLLDDGIYFDSEYNNQLFESKDFVITEPLRAILETQAKQKAGQSNQFSDRDIKNTTKNPGDFALWKFVSADSLQKWRFEDFWDAQTVLEETNNEILTKWGCPGWHSECVAMICDVIGQVKPIDGEEHNYYSRFSFEHFGNQTVIDLHLGGEDHIDVHHKNEILQSEALGFHLSKYWVHNKFVLVDGKKMSKSLGNVFLVEGKYEDTGFYSLSNPPQEVQDKYKIKRFDPLAYRLMLMEHHYTTQLDFTWDKLAQSQARLFNLRKMTSRITSCLEFVGHGEYIYEDNSLRDRVLDTDFVNLREKLLNNLDINSFLGEIQSLIVKSANETSSFGFNFENIRALITFEDNFLKLGLFPNSLSSVSGLAIQRQQVKTDKNWAEADRLRQEIAKLGYQVDDYPWGYGLWYNPTLMG